MQADCLNQGGMLNMEIVRGRQGNRTWTVNRLVVPDYVIGRGR